MPYQYLAYTEEGDTIRGTTDAPSSPDVEEMLWRSNYYIVNVKEVRPPTDWREFFPSFFGVKTRDVIVFTRQLATLVNSGVPLLPSFVLLREQVSSPTFRKALREVITEIEGGNSVSMALKRFPLIFPEIYTRMVEVGEKTGRLERVLEQVAIYMEKQQAIMGRVQGALMYPLFILLLATAVVSLMVTFALPAMVGIFKEFGTELPWTTRLVVGIADFFQNNLLKMLLVGALGSVLFTYYYRGTTGKRQIHILLLKVPIIGPIIITSNLATFTRSMAILLRAGIALPDIMDLTMETVDNLSIKDSLRQVRTGLLQGHGLAYPLDQDPLFPKLLSQMVKIGEESGALDTTLEAMTDFYEKEADRSINDLTSKIEPAMLMVVGGVVGFIAISVITPMYSLIGGIK